MRHDLPMGRPKKYDLPDNVTFDKGAERYIVRNPKTKKTAKFSDKEKACQVAEKLNRLLAVEKELEALNTGRPTIRGLVAKWLSERLPLMPWAPSTAANMKAKMNRIDRQLGTRSIALTDCMYIEEWISGIAKTADTFNDWRYAFVLLWKFAVSRKLAETNEPERIEERSTSKKIESNRKRRQPLDIPGFKAIHEKGPPFLRLAMEQSLITLQARLEICNCQLDHYRDDYLFVIRHKTHAESEMAFIKIRITDELEALRKRSLWLDGTKSPYLIHRRPDRTTRQTMETKPHWTYVTPDYLTKAFAAARDATELYKDLKPDERPSFHEIRGLGARLYREQGMSEAAIQALMAHADPKATEIYLEGGAEALKDSDFHPVSAPLVLRDLLS